MFQNIAEETVQNVNENTEADSKIIRILKELFKLNNIIIYVLTFFISMITVKDVYIPLGIAMVAACLGSTVPIFLVYISSLVGTAISLGSSEFANVFWLSIVYFLLITLFKPKVCIEERNEIYKTGSRLFWAYILCSIVRNWGSDIWVSDLFSAGITGGILYVFYKIFVNGIIIIKDFKIKKVFTIEETASGIAIVVLALSFFNNNVIDKLTISSIVGMFLIIILGWQKGMLAGISTALLSGIMLAFVQAFDLSNIIVFVVPAVVVGFLSTFKKMDLQKIFGRTKMLDNVGETRLTENKEIVSELEGLKETIEENFAEENEEQLENQKYERYEEAFFENLEEIQDNIFYDELILAENDIIRDVFNILEKNDIILEDDLVDIFKRNNNYILVQDQKIKEDLRAVIKIANRAYKIIQIENIKINENKKANKKIAKVAKEVAKAVDTCIEKVAQNKDEKLVKKEKEIQKILSGKNIPIENANIRLVKNGKYIVEIKLDIKDTTLRDKSRIANISDLISKTIGSKMSFQKDRRNLDTGEYTQTYSTEDKFVMQVGSSKISKEDSEASGDCNLQMRLDDGKYILAISDGMGTGAKARENSKLVITRLKKLLQGGFEKEQSINLINSALSLKTKEDEFATLDMCVLDLYDGNLSFVKNGACNTYIKNKKNISIIKSEEMPIGTGLEVNLKEKILPVSDGDIIVICSDGLVDSKEDLKKDWVEEFLKNISTNNVQKISDMILAEAIDNNYGVAADDITVIVAKILKKK
ncbi:MAG: SpoIIE family protein phosphatase [Clostridia bacterium]|nr:SpoIIE family protein phosphatase [Clostridia bacterium]